MAFNAPIDDKIRFPNQQDSLPTTYDAGNSAIAPKFTKLWAEYHNKIRNFIGVMQPLITPDTAHSPDDTVNSMSYWTLNPAPTVADILYANARQAYNLGKSPPTHVLPFEIIITSSNDDYSKCPDLENDPNHLPPMIYKASTSDLNKLVGNGSFFNIRPFVQCNLRNGNDITLNNYSTRWLVNSYCVPGSDTLLIRGCLININYGAVSVITTTLPPLETFFPDSLQQNLHVTIVGAR